MSSCHHVIEGYACLLEQGHAGDHDPGGMRADHARARRIRDARFFFDSPPAPRVVHHVVFPLPLYSLILGESCEFEVVAHPDSIIRPRRLCVNVQLPNLVFLESVVANNQIIIGSPVDAYHFAPQNLQLPVYVRQTNPVRPVCAHCGAPRTEESNGCIHCGTLWPKEEPVMMVMPASEDGGRAIHCPTIRPSGRVLLRGRYNGYVPPGTFCGMPYEVSAVFFGDGLE